MLKDRELENQINFLEEANGNLNTLESIFLELKSNHHSYLQNIDIALKVIHSIKAGADIIGFPLLSDFAHRLADALQDFKKQTNFLEIDTELHSLLLSSVEWLRQIVKLLSVGYVIDEQWLASFCFPVFDGLKKRLSQQIGTNNPTQYSPTQELEDIILLIFQTEVEEYLQHLKYLLAKTDKSTLKAEVIMIATQLGDLGELLHLKAFTQLCQSVMQNLEAAVSNVDVTEIAKLALLTWQRSQTLILTKQLANLPTEIAAQNLSESFVKAPFHLSSKRVMLVECNGMLVALPTNIIVETCLLEQLDSEFLHWQGSTIRLIKLEQYLQSYNLHPAISSSDTLPQIDTANVLIIRDNNQQVAVQIDHFWGEIEVSLYQVEANTTLPTGISNYTILDNEQIVPVLSTSDLLNWITTNQLSKAT